MAGTLDRQAAIHFEIHGTTGSPVVMSAGMGGSAHFWTPQLEALASRHRVLVYDHVGTGRSSREPPLPDSIAGMAADVVALMDAAGFDDAHFVGHAIGGIVGLELALLAPARLRSLVLVNAWAKADAHLRRCFAVRKRILLDSGPAAYVDAQPLFLFPPHWIAGHDAQLRAEAEHMVASFPSIPYMLQRIDMFLAFDGLARLGDVRTQTLVMSTRDDALVPAYLSDALAAALPAARLQVLDHGAHAFTAVDPPRFNDAALAFWAELDRTHQ